MNSVAVLTVRNLRLFFRDRAAVFFSLLSSLILIALYALFLGRLQVDNLTEALPNASAGDIQWFVNAWVFAGITMITTLTTALAALSIFVEDRSSGRFRDFLASPIRRWQLILGYFLSSLVISVLMTVLVAVVGQAYMLIRGEEIMAIGQMAEAAGWIVLSSAAFAALSSFIVTFLKSSGAFAALSTVVGTLIGFLAGAYIPAGTLPSNVVSIMNALPFAQSAMLIRGPFTQKALNAVTDGPAHAEALKSVESFYGITASVGDWEITATVAALMLAGVLVVFTALGAWRLSRKIR